MPTRLRQQNRSPEPRLLVLKLGGSLVESGRIGPILELLGRATRPMVIVPGGGPFADAVRQAQSTLGLSDATAHRLAILAMHQMAEVLIAGQPKLIPADTLPAMRKAWVARRIPVWLPYKMQERDTQIPADWSVTSDGLAARLAERLGHTAVALVKSRDVPDAATAADLARQGIVDQVFADVVGRADLEWRVLGPGDMAELGNLLAVVEPTPNRGNHRRQKEFQ
jgi:aspartokinase-like uncharacterized kinase